MTYRRLLVVGGLLVLGGAAILLFVFVDRTQEPKRTPTAQMRGFGTVSVRITDPSGGSRKHCLLAARTERQQTRGLMQVRDRTLAGHNGMAFLFKTAQQTGFWMRNTPMPLSIAYFDRAGRVVSMTDMAPCADSPSCPSYSPAGPYTTAIEVPRGRFPALGIGPGSRLVIGDACAGSTTG